MHKLRVGVLMGGKSAEKEVSFNSGRTVCDHLDSTRYTIIPLFQTQTGTLYLLPWHFLHRGKISDFQHRLAQEAKKITWDTLKQQVDFVFLAMHGRFAEDGTVQGFLEILNIPYLGSKTFASALSMDKVIQKKVLALHGINVPKGIHVIPQDVNNFASTNKQILEQLKKNDVPLPWVVKPYKEGSSLGVSIVKKATDLLSALQKACNVNEYQQQTVLVEEKLEGMEFSCITITDYTTKKLLPLPPTEIVPEKNSEFFDYEQKYMPGRATKHTPARCSQEQLQQIQDVSMQAMRALEMTNISRIDGFLTPDNRVVIVDPNTLSGMGPASFLFREAAEINMSHTQLINHLIETELESYGMLENVLLQEKQNQKNNKKKLRVAVLMGGASHEREVSLESGRNVTHKLSPHTYEVIPIFVNSNMELFKINQALLVRNSTKEIAHLVEQKNKIGWHDLPNIADFIFIGLHGGKGENGCVQGTLEMLGLPYNGSSVLTSALCMDKFKTNTFLGKQGFDVAQSLLITKHDWTNNPTTVEQHIIDTIALPLIVKPHDDGCSVMVEKITTQKKLHTTLTTIFKNKKHALVEEFLTGMELTVGVFGNDTVTVLPPSQTVVHQDVLSMQEKFLPGAGENQTPAPLSKQATQFVQKTIHDVYKAIGCTGYARIDCFYQSAKVSPTKKERVTIIEINTLPAMTPATCIFHQAAEIGIRPMEFIDRIINLGLEKHSVHSTIHTTKKSSEKQI